MKTESSASWTTMAALDAPAGATSDDCRSRYTCRTCGMANHHHMLHGSINAQWVNHIVAQIWRDQNAKIVNLVKSRQAKEPEVTEVEEEPVEATDDEADVVAIEDVAKDDNPVDNEADVVAIEDVAKEESS